MKTISATKDWLTRILEVIQLVLGLTGAFLIALGDPSLIKYAIMVFIVKELTMIIFSYKYKFWAILMLSIGYIIIDSYSLTNWITQ